MLLIFSISICGIIIFFASKRQQKINSKFQKKNDHFLALVIDSQKNKFTSWVFGAKQEKLNKKVSDLEESLKDAFDRLAISEENIAREKDQHNICKEELIKIKHNLEHRKLEETEYIRGLCCELKKANQECHRFKNLNKNLCENFTNLRNQLDFYTSRNSGPNPDSITFNLNPLTVVRFPIPTILTTHLQDGVLPAKYSRVSE